MTNILIAKDITKTYGDNLIFKELTLELEKGKTLALLGPSGIGKTTLLNILSGVISPDSGSVFLRNQDITGKPGQISYMQQRDLLLPYYTVLENVALPLIIKGERKKDAIKKVSGYFEFFGISGYENKYPREMSGGMRQRAALLRTYIQSQDVVLLDEPFGALDAVTRTRMQKWYLEISAKLGLSTVIITHDTDEALILADKVIVMQNAGNTKVIDLGSKPEGYELTEDFLIKKREILSYL
ncbi:MAG: ATP-binding cassette domain-containing protein [Ruminococcaceae bacterium]|nr:ATP-binding cassette domain-containing protein [Oscillospiraceae bacterium]